MDYIPRAYWDPHQVDVFYLHSILTCAYIWSILCQIKYDSLFLMFEFVQDHGHRLNCDKLTLPLHISAPKDLANALARPCYVTWWLAFVRCTNPQNGFIQLHRHLNEFAMFDVLFYGQMAFHHVFNLELDLPLLLKDSLNHLFEHQATDTLCRWSTQLQRWTTWHSDTWQLQVPQTLACNGLLHLTLRAWVWEWHARAR